MFKSTAAGYTFGFGKVYQRVRNSDVLAANPQSVSQPSMSTSVNTYL